MKKCVQFLTMLLLVISLVVGYAFADDVQPGVDLFESPPGGASHIDISLPSDFFGPGSDPFDGTVALRGKSLVDNTIADDLEWDAIPPGGRSMIVERLATAVLPGIGSYDTVPIEIIALRLVSVEPIVVTYGGIDPELWDLEVTLSSYEEQPEGMMTIHQEYDNGGTYTGEFPVIPRLTFTRESDLQQAVMDPAPLEYLVPPVVPPMPLPAEACWSHTVPFPIVTSDGTAEVDHDGNPVTPPVPVGPSSNFVAGGCGFTASGERPTESVPPTDFQKVLCLLSGIDLACQVQPANPLDHFKVYAVDPLAVAEFVTLHDQFDPAGTVQDDTLLQINYFANPVNKNYEGIADPNAHLIWYRITSPDPTTHWVDVRNQFIGQRLTLGPAQYLLVPAEKVEPGSEFPVMLDHYKCYPVIHGKELDENAHLMDQFIDEDVAVGKPVFFCNPVDKNGEGIINEVDHLVFYEIDPNTVFDPPLSIEAVDQFNLYPLTVTTSLWLGVPSAKLQWGTWPTEVGLSTFDAVRYDGRVEVVWTTVSEVSNGGFNIHRSLSEDGPHAPINDELIPGRGSELQGASYSFVDGDVVDGLDYYYWLESIDLSGAGTMHGPVFASAEAGESPVPAAFGLAQNHPNPFNPVTEIKYNLPVDCYVTLEVYDVLGRRVATLVNDYQTAGFKVAHWQVDSEVSSGVYFYKLRAGSYIETRKMVLLR